MKANLRLCSLAICLTLLTGCVTREEADKKMGRACEAAASIFRNDGFTVKSVNKVNSRVSKKLGNGYRDVTVSVTESDSWLDVNKDYNCTFIESFGMFNSSFDANLYRIEVDGQVFGLDNGQILGGPEIQIQLERAVKSVLYD
ncbi:MAG: hypothetical protein OEY94_02825 [Alphaproteobacteria bacterium]|nr:hypothetical protein [Alphaproteobacteria bacterium]